METNFYKSTSTNLNQGIQWLSLRKKILLFCLLCVGLGHLNAQSRLWMVGNQVINFNNPSSVSVQSLPQPTVAAGSQNRAYSGALPKMSEFVEYDQNGSILFFMVDGAIYDKDGYLMVKDAVGAFAPYSTYPSVIYDLQVVKIPRSCDKYFIIYSANQNDPTSSGNFYVSVLDLALPNQYWPTRKGGLFRFSNCLDSSGGLDQQLCQQVYDIDFYSFLSQVPSTNSTDNVILDYSVGFNDIIWLGSGQALLGGVRTDMFIYDDHVDLQKKLVVAKGTNSWVMNVEQNGIFYTQSSNCIGYHNDFPLINSRMSYAHNNNHNVVLSVAETSGNYSLGYMDAQWQDDLCYPLPANSPIVDFPHGITSTESSFNEQYMYIISQQGTTFRYIDLNSINSGIQDVPGLLNVSNAQNYKYCQMAKNYYQGQPSIFLFQASGISVLQGVDNPATVTLVPNPFPGLTVPTLDLNTYITSGSPGWWTALSSVPTPCVVQPRMYASMQYDELNLGACCVSNHAPTASSGLSVNAGTATWTNGQNPFQNGQSPIYVAGDIVFHSGASVDISGMEFRFGPQANVIIEAGAMVKLSNQTLLTSYECKEQMWPGVDLLGTSSFDQPSTDAPGSYQGILLMDHSTIENAMYGVEVGKIFSNTGGVLKGLNAMFHNCYYGVYYRPYTKVQHGNWINSRWIVDAHLKDSNLSPKVMACLNGMKGNISFDGCSFLNLTSDNTYSMYWRGAGISAFQSHFSVSGNLDPYSYGNDQSHTTFLGWRYGVYANSSLIASYQITKMYFQQCNQGIVALSYNNSTTQRCVFQIPDYAPIFEKPKGVNMLGCSGFTFNNNAFNSLTNVTGTANVGVLLKNCGTTNNLSYRNSFTNLWKGHEVQGSNKGSDSGLQVCCNTYTTCLYDQYLAHNAEWNHYQGSVSSLQSLANNRFSQVISGCDINSHDMFVFGDDSLQYYFDYKCAVNAPEEYIPNCQSLHLEVVFMPNQVVLTPSLICPTLPVPDIHAGDGYPEYQESKNTLNQARNTYKELVDANDTEKILEILNGVFPLESELIADFITERFPLSDTTLKTIIGRAELFDQWNLVQVLMANCPLSRDVMSELVHSEILSPYFLSLVSQFQSSGISSYREMLEEEIATLESETSLHYQNYINALDSIHTMSSAMDSIMKFAQNDTRLESELWMVDWAICRGDSAWMEEILSSIDDANYFSDFRAFKEMEFSLKGNWINASSDQLSILDKWFGNEKSSAHALAWGILHSLEVIDLLPEPEDPETGTRRLSSIEDGKDNDTVEVKLMLTPNPTIGQTLLCFPKEFGSGLSYVFVYDALGQMVYQARLNALGSQVLDLTGFSAGVYVVTCQTSTGSIFSQRLEIAK